MNHFLNGFVDELVKEGASGHPLFTSIKKGGTALGQKVKHMASAVMKRAKGVRAQSKGGAGLKGVTSKFKKRADQNPGGPGSGPYEKNVASNYSGPGPYSRNLPPGSPVARPPRPEAKPPASANPGGSGAGPYQKNVPGIYSGPGPYSRNLPSGAPVARPPRPIKTAASLFKIAEGDEEPGTESTSGDEANDVLKAIIEEAQARLSGDQAYDDQATPASSDDMFGHGRGLKPRGRVKAPPPAGNTKKPHVVSGAPAPRPQMASTNKKRREMLR